VSEGGEIDIDDGGHVVSRFLPELQRDLGLAYQPENWDERALPPGSAAICLSPR
jgi:type III restriction enzyme